MKKEKPKKKNPLLALLKIILIIVIVVVLLLGALVVFLSATEYKPADRENVEVAGEASGTLKEGQTVKIISWNVGYCALGDNADFFMDGGKMVNTATKERVGENLNAIIEYIRSQSPDLILLQETDICSDRSHRVNEVESVRDAFGGYESAFAYNFKVEYLPYPIPPIGKVGSGILTLSRYNIETSERIKLPCPFSWPVSMMNFKRCLDVSRIPIEGCDKQLVLINLHLEAYDNGEGKIAQTEATKNLMNGEVEKGNYVIAGGDFNQIFSSEDQTLYPAQEGKWAAGQIDVGQFGSGWQFLMDERVPSCRSLDQPLEGADKDGFQFYLIDGFIVSDNVKVLEFETRDLGFINSDHNPVYLEISLGNE